MQSVENYLPNDWGPVNLKKWNEIVATDVNPDLNDIYSTGHFIN